MFAQSDLKIMANSFQKFPITEDDVIITCPRCDSTKVLVKLNTNNFYEVKECHECGYRNLEI